MLVYSGFEKLFYWTSGNTAEVDFLLQIKDGIVPLEVKSGLSTKSKSLKVYTEKYNPFCVIRSSKMNLSKNGIMLNLPLYLVGHLSLMMDMLQEK